MSVLIQEFEKSQAVRKKPDFRVGDTVKVHLRIKEGEKERVQVYEGVVTGIKGGSSNLRFTVRKISYGVGVEKSFFYHSSMIKEVKTVRSGKVRRAKLYYLRQKLSKKDARIQEKRGGLVVPVEGTAPTAEELVPELAPEEKPEEAPKSDAPAAEAAPKAEEPKS